MAEIRKIKSLLSTNIYICTCSTIFIIFGIISGFLGTFLFDEYKELLDKFDDKPDIFWSELNEKYLIHIISAGMSLLLTFFSFVAILFSWIVSIIKSFKLGNDNQYKITHIILSFLNIFYVLNLATSTISIIICKKKIKEIQTYLDDVTIRKK